MSAPATPSAPTIAARALGENSEGAKGESLLAQVTPVSGATSYVFQFGSSPELESGHALTVEVTAPLINQLNICGVPGETNPYAAFPIATAINALKVKARNADGDSAWSPTLANFTTRALSDLTFTDPANLTAPTPTGASVEGLVITVTYDYHPATLSGLPGGREEYIRAQLYASDGTTLLTSTTDAAITNNGTGRTIKLTAPTLSTSYKVKLQGGGWNGSATLWATNATVLTVAVPGLDLEPNDATVAAGQPFSISLAGSDATESLAVLSIPEGTALSAKSGTDPQLFTGTLFTVGSVDCTFLATLSGVTETVHLALTVAPPILAPTEIEVWQGDEVLELAIFEGEGTVNSGKWFLTNGPPGITIGSIDIPAPYGEIPSTNVVAIAGSPTASGIFEATVSCIVTSGGKLQLWSAPIRFVVSGGLFLGWFHGADPENRELQLLLRSRAVTAFSATEAETLFLTYGDQEALSIIVRDGPMSTDDTGRAIVSTGFTDLRFVVRPPDNLDATPYLDLGGAAVPTMIGGQTVFSLPFTVASDYLRESFAALNQAPGASSGSATLTATGILTWIRNGKSRSSRTFTVTLAQNTAQ